MLQVTQIMNNHKVIIATLAIILMLSLLDFNSRLLVSSADSKMNNQEIDSNENAVQILSNEKVQELTTLLAEFDVKKVAQKPKETVKAKVITPKITLMSKAEQEKQSGNLSDLFHGEDKYELIATFNDSIKKFALIQKTHLMTNKTTTIKLYQGEDLVGYQLQNVGFEELLFVKEHRKINLKLFLIKS